MKRLAIYGASGHGKVVAEVAELSGWSEITFFDEAFSELQQSGAWPVVGDYQTLITRKNDFDAMFVAIGNNATRQQKSLALREAGLVLATIKHPQAVVSKHAEIGSGVVVMAGAVINPFATIADDVIVNSNAVVEHDTDIGRAAHICPGASLAGGVKVGERVWVGIGSAVKQQISIGDDSVIGAGAAVVSDIPSKVMAHGVPAKIIKSI